MLARAVCPWGVDIGCPFQSWNVFPSGTAVGVTVWGLEGHPGTLAFGGQLLLLTKVPKLDEIFID